MSEILFRFSKSTKYCQISSAPEIIPALHSTVSNWISSTAHALYKGFRSGFSEGSWKWDFHTFWLFWWTWPQHWSFSRKEIIRKIPRLSCKYSATTMGIFCTNKATQCPSEKSKIWQFSPQFLESGPFCPTFHQSFKEMK